MLVLPILFLSRRSGGEAPVALSVPCVHACGWLYRGGVSGVVVACCCLSSVKKGEKEQGIHAEYCSAGS